MSKVKKEFEKMLRSHDWTYQYSDDMRYWRAGNEQSKKIREFRISHPEYKDEFDEMYRQHNPFT